VFLHDIQPGPASRSYGVHVARLAGMPASLIRQARATLEALETQQQAADSQIDLFAPPSPPPEREYSVVEAALSSINPDVLSPKEALDALYRLKAVQQEGSS
jgi:DNA mismatch repair protein MutS